MILDLKDPYVYHVVKGLTRDYTNNLGIRSNHPPGAI